MFKVGDIVKHNGGSIWRVESTTESTITGATLLAYGEFDVRLTWAGHHPVGTRLDVVWPFYYSKLYTGKRTFNQDKSSRICNKILAMYAKRKEQGYAF